MGKNRINKKSLRSFSCSGEVGLIVSVVVMIVMVVVLIVVTVEYLHRGGKLEQRDVVPLTFGIIIWVVNDLGDRASDDIAFRGRAKVVLRQPHGNL